MKRTTDPHLRGLFASDAAWFLSWVREVGEGHITETPMNFYQHQRMAPYGLFTSESTGSNCFRYTLTEAGERFLVDYQIYGADGPYQLALEKEVLEKRAQSTPSTLVVAPAQASRVEVDSTTGGPCIVWVIDDRGLSLRATRVETPQEADSLAEEYRREYQLA